MTNTYKKIAATSEVAAKTNYKKDCFQSNTSLGAYNWHFTAPAPVVEPKAKLFGIKNDAATLAAPCKPWDFKPNIPAQALKDKDTYVKWRGAKSTEHLCFSAAEAISPGVRPNKETNPVRRLHGLVADYDCAISEAMEQECLKTLPADLQPNWIAKTFSNGRRLVWLFEEPIAADHRTLTKEFLKTVRKELKLDTLLPGLDGAFENVEHFYDVGTDWQSLSEKRLPLNWLQHMLTLAARKVSWHKEGGLEIPLETVAEKVAEFWPSYHLSSFKEGERVPVFWDGGSNPTSCVVYKEGCVCFSREKQFYTWPEIFAAAGSEGIAFIRKFEADKIGGATSGVFFDGKRYWKKEQGAWHDFIKEDFAMRLRSMGLESRKQSNAVSKVEEAILHVQNFQRVSGCAPFLFNLQDIVALNDEKFLNISTAKVVQPADTHQEWGVNFPWLANFVSTCWDAALLDCVEDGSIAPQQALDVFLAWFQRLYISAWQGQLEKGQALFLAGDTGVGKTLLSVHVIAKALGGGIDATSYLMGDAKFTKAIFKAACWEVHDAKAKEDPRGFAEMIKKTIANPMHLYEPKFHDATPILWDGRVIVTLNDDDESLAMVPDTSSGLADKLILLKFSDVKTNFPRRWMLEPLIASELPFFLRWLVDWKVPEPIKGTARYGIKSFMHTQTQNNAALAGGVRELLETLTIYGRNRCEHTIKGTAAEWLKRLSHEDGLKLLGRNTTNKSLGRKLKKASQLPSGKTVDVELVEPETQHKGDSVSYKVTFREHIGEYTERRLAEIEEEKKELKRLRDAARPNMGKRE